MINTSNIEEAKRLIKRSTKKPIIVKAQENEFNRKILEYGGFDILLGVELGRKRPSLKNIDSGLNHVLAKIAAKNRIAIGLDLDEIRGLGKKEKAQILERIAQNIKITRKAKALLKILNYKTKTDAFNFLISLGASTAQAKESTE